MTATEPATEPPRRRIPADLSTTGKLVHPFLAERGAATAEDLKAALDVPEIRLYPALRALERDGHLQRRGEEFAMPG